MNICSSANLTLLLLGNLGSNPGYPSPNPYPQTPCQKDNEKYETTVSLKPTRPGTKAVSRSVL